MTMISTILNTTKVVQHRHKDMAIECITLQDSKYVPLKLCWLCCLVLPKVVLAVLPKFPRVPHSGCGTRGNLADNKV